MLRKKIFLIFILILVSDFCLAFDQDKYTISTNFRVDDYNYTSTGYHTDLTFYFVRPKQWFINAGGIFDNKFSTNAGSFLLGGGYFFTDETYMTLTGIWSHENVVVPRQSYEVTINQVIAKDWLASLGYRFNDYSGIDTHTIFSSLTYYFHPDWEAIVRYGFLISDLPTFTGKDHSIMGRIGWKPHEKVSVYTGYAFGQESFEIFPPPILRGFNSHYFFGGAKWEFIENIKLNLDLMWEDRNNGKRVIGYNTGLTYTW